MKHSFCGKRITLSRISQLAQIVISKYQFLKGRTVSASTEFTLLYLVYPKNAWTEISRNADAEAEKTEAGSPLKCKTQRLAATVEAAGTVSGDQPLVEAKENSKYKTQRLAATGTDDSQTSIIKSRSQMVLARIN